MGSAEAGTLHARGGEAWTRRQRLKNDLIFAAASSALRATKALPRGAVKALTLALALGAWALLGPQRRRARARLEAALGRRATGREVWAAFRTAGETLADTVALLDPAEAPGATLELDPEGAAVFRAALDEGRGVVFVSAHLGSWERLAALLASHGFPCATVARESYDARFTQLYERLRAPRGVKAIYRGREGAAAAIARELKAGRAVGFLVDLPSRVPSLRVSLLGEDADLPVGPARLALGRNSTRPNRRAAVLVGTVVPGPNRVTIERVDTSDLEAGPAGERTLTHRVARALEARIALAPEAWLGLFAPARAGAATAGRQGPARSVVSLREIEDCR